MDPKSKVYSEQEASAILKRAAEIAEASSTYTSGVTQAELQRIADEVGLPPEALAQALAESSTVVATKASSRFKNKIEMVIDGELDPADMGFLLEFAAPFQRNLTQIGRAVDFNASHGLMQSRVSVSSKNGRTKVTLDGNAIGAFFLTVYPALVLSIPIGIAMAVRLGPVFGLIVPLILVMCSIFPFFKLVELAIKKQTEFAELLKTRIQEEIGETGLRAELSKSQRASTAETETVSTENQRT